MHFTQLFKYLLGLQPYPIYQDHPMLKCLVIHFTPKKSQLFLFFCGSQHNIVNQQMFTGVSLRYALVKW